MSTPPVPGLPVDQDGPVFREPWEAQAFALAVSLQQRGVFTWGEWSQALGAEIRRAQQQGDPDTGATYYRHWLATLEHVLAEKGLAPHDEQHRTYHAWEHAAARTPHGTPIELRDDDF